MPRKKIEKKYPLISIIGMPMYTLGDDAYNIMGMVVRQILRRKESGELSRGYDELKCHNDKDRTCNSDCAAICLVEYGESYGLACLANYPEGMAIGILDMETTDQEILECMKWGSDLHEQWENDNGKK